MKQYGALLVYSSILKAFGFAAALGSFGWLVFSALSAEDFLPGLIDGFPGAAVAALTAISFLVSSEFVAAYRDVAVNADSIARTQIELLEVCRKHLGDISYAAHKQREYSESVNERLLSMLTEQCQYLSDIATKD